MKTPASTKVHDNYTDEDNNKHSCLSCTHKSSIYRLNLNVIDNDSSMLTDSFERNTVIFI